MLKKGSVAFVVFLAALGLAGASCGKSDQEKSSSASSPSPGASPAIPPSPPPGPSAGAPAPGAPGSMAAAREATGEVVSANPGAKTLVVKANGSEMTFDVKETAASDLGTMKPGDRVTVQYTENAGKYTAEMIRKG